MAAGAKNSCTRPTNPQAPSGYWLSGKLLAEDLRVMVSSSWTARWRGTVLPIAWQTGARFLFTFYGSELKNGQKAERHAALVARLRVPNMGEGRKRVLAMIAGIPVARHLKTADDLFGRSQGNPRTDGMVTAAVQWAEEIMAEIDRRWPTDAQHGHRRRHRLPGAPAGFQKPCGIGVCKLLIPRGRISAF